jgi:hypothetical protein
MRLGKSVEPAMMQDEAVEKIPVRSRSGCDGPSSTEAVKAVGADKIPSTRIKVAARPRLLRDRNSRRTFG